MVERRSWKGRTWQQRFRAHWSAGHLTVREVLPILLAATEEGRSMKVERREKTTQNRDTTEMRRSTRSDSQKWLQGSKAPKTRSAKAEPRTTESAQ